MAGRVGQQFGNYRLVELLGSGGFAEVYLGQHLRVSSQRAALKILSSHLDENTIRAFQREAEIIASLDHPHIVRILDFDVADDIPFLVMNYAPYGSLRVRHHRGEQVPLLMVASYVQQIANGLQYAHEKKLIHCDIKPENMLIDGQDKIVLSDFGITKIAHSTNSQSIQTIIGTFPYTAPEQFQGLPCPASDQYALAITIYEWLTGSLPFTGTLPEIMRKHEMVPPPSLHEKYPTIPKSIEYVVFTALAKDPKARFKDVQEFAQALAEASRSMTPDQQPPVPGRAYHPVTATIPTRSASELNGAILQASSPATESQKKPASSPWTSPTKVDSSKQISTVDSRQLSIRKTTAKTGGPLSLQNLLQSMDTALSDEIRAKQAPENVIKHIASDGKFLSEIHHRFRYVFELEDSWSPEDEAQITIEFSDPSVQPTDCKIVGLTENKITIEVDAPFPVNVLYKAWLVEDSTNLVKRLQERLHNINEGAALLGSKTFGLLPYVIRSSSSQIIFDREFSPNTSQQRAINQALGSEVTYIIGPPGTGKTATLAAIAFSHLCAGRTVLIAANTNIAVDNAIMRVVDIIRSSQNSGALQCLLSNQVICYGKSQLESQLKSQYSEVHLPSIVSRLSYSLDQEQEVLRSRLRELIQKHDSLEKAIQQQREKANRPLSRDIVYTYEKVSTEEGKKRRGPRELFTRLFTKGITERPSQRAIDLEYELQLVEYTKENIQAQLNEVEAKRANIEQQVVAKARVIATTLAKTYMNSSLFERRFDIVIVDEASMALPPVIYAIASHSDHSVTILGDPQQLEPIVSAKTHNAEEFLKKDIFTLRGISILAASREQHNSILLTEQARMHPHIANMVSQRIYENRLKNSILVQDETRWQQYARVLPLQGQSLVLCDTGGSSPHTDIKGKSRSNTYHAHCCLELASQVLRTLPARDIQKNDFRIGLVTPYAKQARMLQRLIKENGLADVVSAGTIHRFQGLEAEVIIFDTVESPPAKPGTFTGGPWGSKAMRLVNVAVTRAQYKLIIVANYTYLTTCLNEHSILRQVLYDAHNAGHIYSNAILPSDLVAHQTLNHISQTNSAIATTPKDENFHQRTTQRDTPRQWGKNILLHRNDFPEETTLICKKCDSTLVLKTKRETHKPFYGCPQYSRDDSNHTTANPTKRDLEFALASSGEFANMTCNRCRHPITVKINGDFAWVECADIERCGYAQRIVYRQ